MSIRPKRTLPLVLFAVFLGACAPADLALTDTERAAVEAEVRTVIDGLLEAMNAHEPKRVVAYYTDAPDFLALTCTSYLTGGRNFKALTGPSYGPRRGATFEHRLVGVRILSPAAAVVSLRGGSTRAPALFWTRVLEKEEGVWRITYEHQSWPGCSEPPAPHPFTAPMEPTDSAGALSEVPGN